LDNSKYQGQTINIFVSLERDNYPAPTAITLQREFRIEPSPQTVADTFKEEYQQQA
jgi:hypothetical protein